MQKPQEKVSKRELAMQARATHVAEATNAMRGSPSCMGKGQGSLANEGTLYPDCLQVPRSIPGLAPANAHWTWTTATWLFKFLPDPGRNRPGTPDILRKIGSSSRE